MLLVFLVSFPFFFFNMGRVLEAASDEIKMSSRTFLGNDSFPEGKAPLFSDGILKDHFRGEGTEGTGTGHRLKLNKWLEHSAKI